MPFAVLVDADLVEVGPAQHRGARLRGVRAGPGGDAGVVDAGPQAVTLLGERSEQCEAARDGMAVYWDRMRSVFHELPEQPLPGTDWVLYQHPDSPLLGFYHPPDYTGYDFRGAQTVGVDLVRDDGRVVWTYLQTWGRSRALRPRHSLKPC